MLTICVFFGGFGCWAALAPLDGAVVGRGEIAVQGGTQTVQHRDGGIVSALLVQNGDQVRQGQILIKLDDTQILAMLHIHQAELMEDQALVARDMAEISGAPVIDFPPSLRGDSQLAQSVTARETIVFRNHLTWLAAQLHALDERIAQSLAQTAGALAQRAATLRGLADGTAQVAALQALERKGLDERATVLDVLRTLDMLHGQIGALQSDIALQASAREELVAEKQQARAAALAEAMKELREAQSRINDILPRLVVDRDMLGRLDIRAPVNGEVVNLRVFTKGGVIAPGEAILQIVPTNRVVVAEAEIRPEDIEDLHVGQQARVIATGFNPRDTAPLKGRVAVISADLIRNPPAGQDYYLAEISLSPTERTRALLSRLEPGMPVDVVVPVEPRTVLEYLLEPLRTSLRAAGHEM